MRVDVDLLATGRTLILAHGRLTSPPMGFDSKSPLWEFSPRCFFLRSSFLSPRLRNCDDFFRLFLTFGISLVGPHVDTLSALRRLGLSHELEVFVASPWVPEAPRALPRYGLWLFQCRELLLLSSHVFQEETRRFKHQRGVSLLRCTASSPIQPALSVLVCLARPVFALP